MITLQPRRYARAEAAQLSTNLAEDPKFSPEFIDTWKKISAAAMDKNDEQLMRLGIKAGFFPRPDLINVEHQVDYLQSMYEPWRDDRVYKFTHTYVEDTWRKATTDNPDKYKLGLPKDWVFTNRLQWGVCALLAELGASANWHRIWRELSEYEKYRESYHAL